MNNFKVKSYRKIEDLSLVEVATQKIISDIIEKLNNISKEDKKSEN